MRGLRLGPVLGALLPAVAVLAVGTSSAHGNDGPIPPNTHLACTASARQAPLALSAPARTARSAALHRYDDHIEDVVSAPDICAANVVTNDNVAVTMAIHLHDRSTFNPLDSYSVLLDTESNPRRAAGRTQERPPAPSTSSTSLTARRGSAPGTDRSSPSSRHSRRFPPSGSTTTARCSRFDAQISVIRTASI